MVDRNIIRQLEVSEEQIDQYLRDALGPDILQGDIDAVVADTIKNFSPGSVLAGTIVGRAGEDVVVEVGLKSEGLVSVSEFDDPSEAALGEKVEVVGIDDSKSSHGRGIVAEIRKQGKTYTSGLGELQIDPDSENSKWLQIFHYWANTY